MSKKITSLILALVLMFSMTTIACVSVSATVNEDYTYTPTDPETETYRYYFYMPTSWYTNDDIYTAGIYWWAGTDACGALDGSGNSVSWPGYKAYAEGTYDQLFYCDVPTDVEGLIWDNYLDGGEDSTAAVFLQAVQTINVNCTYYAADFSDNYDQDFFDAVQEDLDTYSADELAEISPYYSNFFVETDWGDGLSFTFDNMIYIIDPSLTQESSVTPGKYTYGGDWYFYYGDGTCGTKLTKEEAMEAEENKAEDDTITYYMTFADVAAADAEAASADEANKNSSTDGDDSTTATEATTADDTDDDDDSTAATSSTDATSATTAADASSSTSDTASTTTTTTDNSAVQTGAAPYAVVFLVLLLAACGALYYTKRKAD